MNMKAVQNRKLLIGVLLGLFAFALSGCNTITGSNRTGIVLAKRTQVRSSYAVVAAELIEVSRGDVVDILEETEVTDQNREDVKERWFHVRITKDDQETEGWIEARNVIPEEMLEQSRKIQSEDKDTPSQAAGQLRASSNLRLSTDYTTNENILMQLESGSVFEIVSWKRVPKPKLDPADDITLDRDNSSKSRHNKSKKKAKDAEGQEIPQETTDLWYKVRLDPSVSPAPAGWIYGKQVELKVPSDIIFYRSGREFVAWSRLDGDSESADKSEGRDRDAGKEQRPGSWVILEKGNNETNSQASKDNPPDFDRIYVLGYEKYDQEHYTAYRSMDVIGFLPLRVKGQGHNKSFTLRILVDGEVKDVEFKVYKDDKGHLKVTSPPEMGKLKNQPKK